MNLLVTSRLWDFLLRLLTWVLVAVAASVSLLLLSLRYWLLPDIEQYRENIAQAISSASGQHLTIGAISANWDGLHPHMVMRTIQVHDKEGDIMLLLHRLEGTLSWRSIFDGNLHFREIVIDQPDLVVRRDPSGVIHVAGFALNKELAGSENGFSDWLLNQRRVIIKNASIMWQDDHRGAPELELLVNLRLENLGHHHRFGLRATPPAELGANLDLRGGSDWGISGYPRRMARQAVHTNRPRRYCRVACVAALARADHIERGYRRAANVGKYRRAGYEEIDGRYALASRQNTARSRFARIEPHPRARKSGMAKDSRPSGRFRVVREKFKGCDAQRPRSRTYQFFLTDDSGSGQAACQWIVKYR